ALTVDHQAPFSPQVVRDAPITPGWMLIGKPSDRRGKLLCQRRLIRILERRTFLPFVRPAVIAHPRNLEDPTGPTHRYALSLELPVQVVLTLEQFQIFLALDLDFLLADLPF